MIEYPIHKFLKDYYIPAIEKLSFHLERVQILGGNECVTTRKEAMKSHKIYIDIREIKYYAGKYSESTSLKIQYQHWVGKRQLFMEIVTLDYFNNDKIVR